MTAGKPLFVVISGPSGVGKDALLSALRKSDPAIFSVVTATTRPMRPGEADGVDYYFLTREQFQEKLAANEFLEHANVYDRWYGVPRTPIREALARGQDVYVRTDVQGAATIKSKAPGVLLIFVAPPSMDELERRLRDRKTDSPEQIELRLKIARKEMGHQRWFDHIVVNRTDALTSTVDEVRSIVAKERCRIPPREVVV